MDKKINEIIRYLYGEDYLINFDEDNYSIDEIKEDKEGYIVNVSCIKVSEFYIPKKDVQKELKGD